MRIGIDARLYTQTGVGRYIQNIIYELGLIDKKNEYVVYLRSQEYNKMKLPNSRWTKKTVDLPWHSLKEQILMPLLLLQDNLDIAHFPYFNVPIFYPKKYLLTIHDLIVDHFDTGKASTLPLFLYHIKRIGYKIIMKLGISRSSMITSISNSTKKEIIEHYNINPDKIVITYDSLDRNFDKVVDKSRPINNYFKNRYILYVGNAYPHKNLENLFMAFKIVLNDFPNLKLVLTGDDNFFYPIFKKKAIKSGLGKNIIFFGEANDEELFALYKFAEFTIFPSLMEGFGLPNFESIRCGKLVAVSDIPVFREIWTDSLIYFNPYNCFDIANKIISILDLKPDQYVMKVKKAMKILDNYSWKKSALTTLAVYNKIYKRY